MVRSAPTSSALLVALTVALAARSLLFAGGSWRSPAVRSAARGATAASEVDEKVRAYEEASVVDEAAMLAQSDFPIEPDELIKLAKVFCAYGHGGEKPELLSEDFEFCGPVVGPLDKSQYLDILRRFPFLQACPDHNPELHHFRVDPFEPSRVWMTARGYGTHSQAAPNAEFFGRPTGKKFVSPPQTNSVSFTEKGLVKQYTAGYVMDKRIGNTGGLGGIFGILYAIDKPLPIPEFQPWKPSLAYSFFLGISGFARKFQKDV